MRGLVIIGMLLGLFAIARQGRRDITPPILPFVPPIPPKVLPSGVYTLEEYDKEVKFIQSLRATITGELAFGENTVKRLRLTEEYWDLLPTPPICTALNYPSYSCAIWG